jgi:hypothetical protein
MLDIARHVFSASGIVTILADKNGKLLMNNYSPKNIVVAGEMTHWIMNQLGRINDTPNANLSHLLQADQSTKLFLGKLTCMNLKVFHEIIEGRGSANPPRVDISTRSKAVLDEVSTLMLETASESVQELIKRTALHGGQTVLKFLNSKTTGAKDALDLDKRFHDIVAFVLIIRAAI